MLKKLLTVCLLSLSLFATDGINKETVLNNYKQEVSNVEIILTNILLEEQNLKLTQRKVSKKLVDLKKQYRASLETIVRVVESNKLNHLNEDYLTNEIIERITFIYTVNQKTIKRDMVVNPFPPYVYNVRPLSAYYDKENNVDISTGKPLIVKSKMSNHEILKSILKKSNEVLEMKTLSQAIKISNISKNINYDEEKRSHYFIQETLKHSFVKVKEAVKLKDEVLFKSIVNKNIIEIESLVNYQDIYGYKLMINLYNKLLSKDFQSITKEDYVVAQAYNGNYLLEQSFTYLVTNKEYKEYLESLYE